MMGQTKMVKRTLLLLTAMGATLIVASGVALAVSKVCPSGSTQANPCLGTNKTKKASGNDTLIGSSGPDYIKALSGNDNISAGEGNDTTDGGGGNDTYSYKDGWGVDTLIDSGGTDALNFSALGSAGAGLWAQLTPELGENYVEINGSNLVGRTDLSSGTVVEKFKGSGNFDIVQTGGAANTLQPGPGAGGAHFTDYGGCPSTRCSVAVPVSSDTYSGFAASGYGGVTIIDWGGTADKLVLPFASTDVYFQAEDNDGFGGLDTLTMMTSSTDSFYIVGQLQTIGAQKGHIEQLQFTDGIMTIGSETAVQTLNAASKLDASEKEKRSKAAKKVIEESKKKAQDTDKDQQQPSPTSSSKEKKR